MSATGERDLRACTCGGRNDCVGCLSAHPAGKTCADCVHVARCVTIFGQKPTDTACQWVPSRAAYRAPLPTP